MFQISELSVLKGEKLQTYYELAKGYTVPITIINGEQDGKTILITAGIHGSEYVGIQAAIELANALNPSDITGQIILIYPVNVSGYYARSFAVLPEDNKNLNRMFPGNENGTLSQQITDQLYKKFQKYADFYIDLHGGDLHENLTPFVFYPGVGSQEVIEESLRIAKTLNVPYRLRSSAKTGSYNFAAMQGCPSILIERGGCGHWSKKEVFEYKNDICSALYHLNVLQNDPYEKITIEQQDLIDPIYIDAPNFGCWYPAVRENDHVEKGHLLGELRDFFGNILQSYVAQNTAIVLYITVSLGVSADMPLIAYASCMKK